MLWQMQCSGNVQSLYILLQICIYDNTTTKLVSFTVFYISKPVFLCEERYNYCLQLHR